MKGREKRVEKEGKKECKGRSGKEWLEMIKE